MAAVAPETQLEHRLPSSESDVVQRLYARYSHDLVRFCRSRLGSREEAEDAVQMTYLYALLALRRGVVPRFESAWLHKIATNVCLTRRRSAGRRERIEVPRDVEELQVARRSDDSSELIDIDAALATLPERQRRAIVLREWQGLSYQEIADELELSHSAVETLIFRARRSLARELSAEREPAAHARALRALDLGTLVGAIKSAAMGASAVKVAAVVAVATSITAIVPSDRGQEEAPASQPPTSLAAPAAEIPPQRAEAAARAAWDSQATRAPRATKNGSRTVPSKATQAPAGGAKQGPPSKVAERTETPSAPSAAAPPALPDVPPPSPVSLPVGVESPLGLGLPPTAVDLPSVSLPPLVTQPVPLPLPVELPALPVP